MSNENNTALAETRTFSVPEIGVSEFTQSELAEDMAGLQLTLSRIKIPAGGGLQFELPGDNPDNPDYAKVLEGVILYQHAAGAYWADGGSEDDDENTPPLCSSIDGVTGMGTPGGACETCEMNKWNTGKNGKGKACKNMRVLYLLRDGEYLPIQLTLPPTSIRPFNEFYNVAFAARRRGTCGSIVQIGLKRMNNGKDDYSVATFKKLHDFGGEQLAQLKAYADAFKAQAKEMLIQQALSAGERGDEMVDVAAPSYDQVFQSGNGSFAVSAEINGDTDELPI